MKKTWLVAVPVTLFIMVAGFLYLGLSSDPRKLDSQIQGQAFPEFSLPDLMEPEKRYTHTALKGEVTIVNVWGVWCITCAIEMPYLTQLKETNGVRFVGLYFDQDLDPDNGTKTLARVQQEVTALLGRYGNPYAFNIFDVYRDTSLDLGVTGAPEHFVIDREGIVRMHHVGDINERVWKNKIGPLYQRLEQDNGQGASR